MTKREECIKKHRELWNGMADEMEMFGKIIHKFDYFEEHDLDYVDNRCYCCEYTKYVSSNRKKDCTICPILWGMRTCYLVGASFNHFTNATIDNNLEDAIKYAREIANLPEREIQDYDI